MFRFILGSASEAVAAGFGTAAAIAVLGIFVLRWYRMRQEFALMRLALEKGLSPQFMPALPQWLISMRQGTLILALGAGLILIGAIGWNIQSKVPPPPLAVIDAGRADAATAPSPTDVALAVPVPRDGPRGEAGRHDPGHRAPEPPKEPPRPHPRDPAAEAWDRAQAQINISMAMIAGGILLVLLGLVRIVFVPVERKHGLPQFAATPANPQP